MANVSECSEFARQADPRDAVIVICAFQAKAPSFSFASITSVECKMKYGAGAVGTRVSGTHIWNTIKYRDQRSITTATRCGLAGDPGSDRSLRSRLLSSVSLAVAATTLAALDARLSPALAQCAGPASNTVCTPGGNNYPSGINVDTNNGLGGTPINLQLLSGVNVVIPAGAGGVNAVNAANTTGVSLNSADITINADGVTINNTANPLSNNNTGLRIQSSGAATITATNTTINVAGTASDWAILAFAMPNLTGTAHDVSVNWSGPSLTSATSIEGGGIQADNRAIGNAIVVASGNINVTGVGNFTTQYGLLAHAGDSLLAPSGAGNALVTLQSGSTLNVSANRPRGILAWVDGNGSATVTTEANTVINVSGTQFGGPGVYVFSSTATAPNALTANVASLITSSGPATTNPSNLPIGIKAVNSDTNAPIFVNYTGPGITTVGGNGSGIFASSGSGSIIANAFGPINTTDGSNAVGILADSGTSLVQTSGVLTDTSTIRLSPTSTTGSVQVNATNVSTLGQFGTGISATAGSGGVTVNVLPGGSVMGGWQADLTSVGSTYGLPAAGVILGSFVGSATLTNDGSIGALSDRAVASTPLFASNNTSIINNGTITGFVQLVGSNNSIVNNGTFNLRHFADTTGAVDASGNGVRDTLRVAVTDLGPGTFTNNGTLALLGGPGATTLDATGQYLPLGLTFNSMALGGPVQGQILGATTFTNSGTIDLQANPVPGDVLLISGGHTPGTTGGGTFIASGGRLLLDTVLNDGGANSRSDVLVVDGTAVGAGGATRLFARNAGGAGALTPNDGILVVQALDPGRSANGVFTLGNAPLVAGPYEYTLFHGGVGADATNGNWYLRSTLNCTLTPTLPECGPEPVPPTPVTPNFRAETSLYAAIPSMALLYGRNLLDTLHERVGEEFDGGLARNALASGYYKASRPMPILSILAGAASSA
jgi:Autochaperone Domain Type 1